MDAVIFDMDGTLADVKPIRHYVRGESRDFHSFHKASVLAPANDWVVEQAHAFSRDHSVVIVTARENRFEWETRDWLAKHDVPFDMLFMRPWGDFRPDVEVKQDMLDAIRRAGLTPVRAFDDNPNVIDLWRRNGLDVVEVPGWVD